jgi:hypothetical protein
MVVAVAAQQHLRGCCEPREFSMEAAVALDFAEESFFRQEEEDQ